MSESVFAAYPGVNRPQVFHCSRQTLAVKINRYQPKLFGVTKLPFEIVEQRPIVESPDVGSFAYCAMKCREVFLQVTFTKILVQRGRAMLGEIDGQFVTPVQIP